MAAAPTQGMNNLTTLIKRLEAATSRLEDIASSSETLTREGSVSGPGIGADGVQHSASAPAIAPGAAGVGEKSVASAQPLPESITDMDEILNKDVKEFVDASKGLDDVVEEQASSVAKAFAEQRRFLLTSTRAKKPDMTSTVFSDMVKTLQQEMSTVSDLRDNNRASPMKEHLSMVGEGITALQWLVMEGKPADFVGEVTGGAQMYGNRVLKAYKESDERHVKYVQSYYALLKSLQGYIQKRYPSGVTWDNNGIDAAQAWDEAQNDSGPQTNGVAAAPAAPAPSGGAPPPPPPPLPNFKDDAPAASSQSKGGEDSMGAVFAQLNRGEAVTSGLKKVDTSQMTHKNPSLRAGSSVPDTKTSADGLERSRSKGPETKPKPASMRTNSSHSQKKPEGKKELDGNKWIVENWDSPQQPLEIQVEIQQSVLISKCKNTTIVLKGKANAVSIDNSPRAQILVETLVSSVDVIKCPNFALQVTGSLPTVMLDQVDGGSIYLGKESLATEVFTSKCSSVNIVLPPAKEEEDSAECPIPEQIRTYIKDGKLVSEIVEHAG